MLDSTWTTEVIGNYRSQLDEFIAERAAERVAELMEARFPGSMTATDATALEELHG